MREYIVCDHDGQFVMLAPIYTLKALFNLRNEAIERVEHEAIGDGVCKLHFNGKNKHYRFVTVLASKSSE